MTTSLAGLLSAQWRDLVKLSYEVDPLLLVPDVPAGTSLDVHDGRTLVTLVGFRGRQADGSTLEYRVAHPSWDVAAVSEPTLDCVVAGVYGARFVTTLSRALVSAFIAPGSEAVLLPGTTIE